MTDTPRLALVPVPGFPFPVMASTGLEQRARLVAGPCAAAYRFLGQVLGRQPHVTMLVLSKEDWPPESLPYGMPHYQGSSNELVVAGGKADFWQAFVPLLRTTTPALLDRAEAVYGPDLTLSPFFDLLAIHELGHAFPGSPGSPGSQGAFPRRWLEELFCNLVLHAYVATTEEDRLPVLTAFPHALAAIDPVPFEHQSLAEFESLYSNMDPLNYGWYQCQLHLAAKQVHDSGGLQALQRLWRRFVFSDAALAAELEREVDPQLARVVTAWPPGFGLR